MDPLNPWLDPIDVRRMAERLLQPLSEAPAPVADPGFGEAFVGFSPDSTVSTPRPAPIQFPIPAPTLNSLAAPVSASAPLPITPGQAARHNPAAAVPQPYTFPAPSAVPVFQVFQSPPPVTPDPVAARSPFLERINRFRDWMRLNFAATGIFILDREGAVLYDESNHGRLHFLARSLALASRRPGTTGRNVHVKISAQATLEVIPVETPYGCLVLGAVVPESLNPLAISAVMDALLRAASPPSDA